MNSDNTNINYTIKAKAGALRLLGALAVLFLLLFFCIQKPCQADASVKDSGDYYLSSDGIWRKKLNYRIVSKRKRNLLGIIREADKKTGYIGNVMLGFESSAGSKSIAEIVQKEMAEGRIMVSDCGTNQINEAVLMFTGDFMCLKGQQYSAEVKGGYDFTPSFQLVKPLFDSADFVCGNLETLISESNPLTKNQVTVNGQPQCNGPLVYLDALKYAGVDAVVMANNHCCDWGTTGINETKRHVEDYKFASVGTNYYDSHGKFVFIDVNDIRIALLSYSHLINQRGKLTSDQMSKMVNCYSSEGVKKDIAAARKKGADFIVVYMHWGVENTEYLNSAQLNDSVTVANAGADLIIGSHPHCLQKCEYIKTDDGRKVLCMYSMGNFVSSMAREINNDTIILRLEIKKNAKTSSVKYKDVSIIPCYVTSKNGKNNVIVPDVASLNGNLDWASLKSSYSRITRIFNNLKVYGAE